MDEASRNALKEQAKKRMAEHLLFLQSLEEVCVVGAQVDTRPPPAPGM